MSHGNARLNLHGRRLLVDRVRRQRWAVAHAAKAMGISWQCAHRWLARFDAHVLESLLDRSCAPRSNPHQTALAVEQAVLAARARSRRGQDWISAELGAPARTVSRILRRHQVAYLRDCDPLTGQVIRSAKASATRYERTRPGELVHVDVKKIGRIPDGGGWKAHGRAMGSTSAGKRARIGHDYVHSMVDDHARWAYSEILPDETGPTCAEFLRRAAASFAAAGIGVIERVLTDNHYSYRRSHHVAEAMTAIGARHCFIKPHCPWQNGKVERFNRTLATEWAYRQVFTSNTERTRALAPWLQQYNTQRRHSALGGLPPASRLSPT